MYSLIQQREQALQNVDIKYTDHINKLLQQKYMIQQYITHIYDQLIYKQKYMIQQQIKTTINRNPTTINRNPTTKQNNTHLSLNEKNNILKSIIVQGPPPNFEQINYTQFHIENDSTKRTIQAEILRRDCAQHYAKNIQIEQNVLSTFTKLTEVDIAKINIYIDTNGIGCCDPKEIEICCQENNGTDALKDCLQITTVKACKIKCLNRQKGVIATKDIDKGVILGEYPGTQYLGSQFNELFDNTNEEIPRMTYKVSSEFYPTINGDVQRESQIVIVDGYDKIRLQNPLLFINDGRENFDRKCQRYPANTVFIDCLLQGYPTMFVKTCTKIKSGDSMWIDYGDTYHVVHNIKNEITDKQKKMETYIFKQNL